MNQKNKIAVEALAYGISVQGPVDSGWQITGITPGVSNLFKEEELYKLVGFSSVGHVSEDWAQIFGNGYGYFGAWREWAVFAHFYRSPVKSTRGRYFVPRSILLVPLKKYVDDLHCDPGIIFNYLLALKKELIHVYSSDQSMISPLYIEVSENWSLEERFNEISKLVNEEKIDEKFLIDFLTCILNPQNSEIIIQAAQKPDIAPFISLLFLLPRPLRRFITFCTCVESPRSAKTKIKFVRHSHSIGDNANAFIIMEENQMIIPRIGSTFNSKLTGMLVEQFFIGAEELMKLHEIIEKKISIENILDYSQTITLVEELITKESEKFQISELKEAKLKFPRLSNYLNKEINERDYVLEEFIKSFTNTTAKDIIENKAEARELIMKLCPFDDKDKLEKLKTHFIDAARGIPTAQLLSFMEIYTSIPGLKQAINKDIINYLELRELQEWGQVLPLMLIVETFDQFRQLEKKKKQYKLHKKSKEFNLWYSLLETIFEKDFNINKKQKEIFCKIDKIKNKAHIFIIIENCFRFFDGKVDDEKKILLLLLSASHAFEYIHQISPQEKTDFIHSFCQFYLNIMQFASLKADRKINRIIKLIKSKDPELGKHMQTIFEKKQILMAHKNVITAYSENEILPQKKDEIKKLFQAICRSRGGRYHSLIPDIFFKMLSANIIPNLNIFFAYAEYLDAKDCIEIDDFNLLFSGLVRDSEPLMDPDLFEFLLSLTLEKTSSESRISLLRLFFGQLTGLLSRHTKCRVKLGFDFINILKKHWKPSDSNEVDIMFNHAKDCFDVKVALKVLQIAFSRLGSEEDRIYLLNVFKTTYDEFAIIFGDNTGYLDALIDVINITRKDKPSLIPKILNLIREIKSSEEKFKKCHENIDFVMKKVKKIKGPFNNLSLTGEPDEKSTGKIDKEGH